MVAQEAAVKVGRREQKQSCLRLTTGDSDSHIKKNLKELRENHVLPLVVQLQGIAKYNAQEKEFIFSKRLQNPFRVTARQSLMFCNTKGKRMT